MSRITITEGGSEKAVVDILPYHAERSDVLAALTRLYAGFENGSPYALDAREQEVVELVNRYNDLTHVIDRFDQASVRRTNILAGWAIVRQHQDGDGA